MLWGPWTECIHSTLLVPNKPFIRRSELIQIEGGMTVEQTDLRILARAVCPHDIHMYFMDLSTVLSREMASLALTYVLRAEYPDGLYEFVSHMPHPRLHMMYHIQTISRSSACSSRRAGRFPLLVPPSLFSLKKLIVQVRKGMVTFQIKIRGVRNLDENRLVDAYINPPTFRAVLQPKVVNTFS